MIPPARASWPGLDGNAVGCREKLKMPSENYAEASQALRDAVLIGVDEPGMHAALAAIVADLGSAKSPVT
jgi:hypothetical protein